MQLSWGNEKKKAITLDQLGKIHAADFSTIRPLKAAPPSVKSSLKVTINCSNESGRIFKVGEIGYRDCINNYSSDPGNVVHLTNSIVLFSFHFFQYPIPEAFKIGSL